MKILIVLFLIISFSANSQKIFPSIDTYGGVFDVPEAEHLLDPNKKYKIVFDITEGEKNPTKDINNAYEAVARLINLYGLEGVKKENMAIVVVVHYQATPTILSDQAFNEVFKENNPNTAIINKLGENGVKFYVCGQSLRARKYVDYKRNENVKVSVGAMTAITHFQSLGYALLKM
jgi:intracellular sulfur oxidation DsrE/DsrF family protein